MKAAFRQHLLDDASISASVGTRIYPDEYVPQSAVLPYLTFGISSRPHESSLSGASGLARARVQLDVWSDLSTETESIADDVRMLIDGYRGTLGSGGNTIVVRNVFLDDEESSSEARTDGTGVALYRHRMDWILWHTETVPTFL